uniref:Domain of unknown function DB domain-containing protein n=1 Tax=Plectus sambesii TaxID=2011161 RepID=A0A914X3S1_9BILA
MLSAVWCRALFLAAAAVTLAAGERLTEADVKAACPKEEGYCASKALQGTCIGSTVTSKVLHRTCQCSCDFVLSDRIQTCCNTVGLQAMRFCLPLCRYNTTIDELTSALGFKCVSQLTTWAYCASDANDNTACCRSRGVPNECLSFCKGDVPTCDLQSIFSYQPCLENLDAITKCQRESLKREPKWDPKWSARCDWDGK